MFSVEIDRKMNFENVIIVSNKEKNSFELKFVWCEKMSGNIAKYGGVG